MIANHPESRPGIFKQAGNKYREDYEKDTDKTGFPLNTAFLHFCSRIGLLNHTITKVIVVITAAGPTNLDLIVSQPFRRYIQYPVAALWERRQQK